MRRSDHTCINLNTRNTLRLTSATQNSCEIPVDRILLYVLLSNRYRLNLNSTWIDQSVDSRYFGVFFRAAVRMKYLIVHACSPAVSTSCMHVPRPSVHRTCMFPAIPLLQNHSTEIFQVNGFCPQIVSKSSSRYSLLLASKINPCEKSAIRIPISQFFPLHYFKMRTERSSKAPQKLQFQRQFPNIKWDEKTEEQNAMRWSEMTWEEVKLKNRMRNWFEVLQKVERKHAKLFSDT
jgi:hypothetical protein